MAFGSEDDNEYFTKHKEYIFRNVETSKLSVQPGKIVWAWAGQNCMKYWELFNIISQQKQSKENYCFPADGSEVSVLQLTSASFAIFIKIGRFSYWKASSFSS